MHLHALVPVPRGTELSISYFNLLLPFPQRQDRARDWGFECACALCSSRSPSRPAAVQGAGSAAEGESGERGAAAGVEGSREDERTRVREWLIRQYKLVESSDERTREALEAALEEGGEVKRVCEEGSLRAVLPRVCAGMGILSAALAAASSGVEGEQERGDERRGHGDIREDGTRDAAEAEKTIQKWVEEAVLAEARVTGPESPSTKERLQTLKRFGEGNGRGRERDAKVLGTGDEMRVVWV